jgi:hypothetical protein
VSTGTIASTSGAGLDAAELQDVRYLEISARATEEDDPLAGEAKPPVIQLMYRKAPGSLHVRAVLGARGADLSITIDALAHFTWAADEEPSQEAIESFVLDEGASILYPYLRTAAADMTQRLGAEPLLLPFFKPGSISAEGTFTVGRGPSKVGRGARKLQERQPSKRARQTSP